MPTVPPVVLLTVPATVDLQFRPQGQGFSYTQGDDAIVEALKLANVLMACQELKNCFELLLPTDDRKWWEGLDLTIENGHVKTSDIEDAFNAKLLDSKITRAELIALRKKLPKKVIASDGKSFPPRSEDGPGKPDDVVLKFTADFPDSGTRTYYGMPDGKVKCCAALTLNLNGVPMLVAHSDIADGNIEVVLEAHFLVQP